MRLIDRLIKDCEEKATEFASGGMQEDARQYRILASKYREMKYNGHTHELKMEFDEWETIRIGDNYTDTIGNQRKR
tara:strand:+ start:22 stop:249 length:228 start_codon:yes stop_codon:yes gene_type:complete